MRSHNLGIRLLSFISAKVREFETYDTTNIVNESTLYLHNVNNSILFYVSKEYF